MTADQEHLKCGTYAKDKNGCTIHFVRTIVLKEIILGELNKMVAFVKDNEDEFVQMAMDNSVQKQSATKPMKTVNRCRWLWIIPFRSSPRSFPSPGRS